MDASERSPINSANCLLPPDCADPQPHRSRGIGRGGKRTGLDLSFHSLRHTAVSLLKDAGVPDSVVLALAGHESAAMIDRYTHVGNEALTKARRTLPEI